MVAPAVSLETSHRRALRHNSRDGDSERLARDIPPKWSRARFTQTARARRSEPPLGNQVLDDSSTICSLSLPNMFKQIIFYTFGVARPGARREENIFFTCRLGRVKNKLQEVKSYSTLLVFGG